MANVLEKSTMFENQMKLNRQQRKWISKLKSDEIQIIEKYTKEQAREIANQYIFNELANFRLAMLASTYLKLGDIVNTNDLQEILMMANELAYRDDYLRNLGADWMKKIDETKELMKEEMTKLWENENIKTQNKMLHAIKMDSRFGQIGNKDIVLVFKELKDEMNGILIKTLDEQKHDVTKAVEYIFEDEVDEIVPQIIEENVQKQINEKKEDEKMEEKKVVINKENIKKESEILKNKFINFAEEREKIETRRKEIEEEQKRLIEEAGRLKVKEDKLGEAISLLEEIGM